MRCTLTDLDMPQHKYDSITMHFSSVTTSTSETTIYFATKHEDPVSIGTYVSQMSVKERREKLQ